MRPLLEGCPHSPSARDLLRAIVREDGVHAEVSEIEVKDASLFCAPRKLLKIHAAGPGSSACCYRTRGWRPRRTILQNRRYQAHTAVAKALDAETCVNSPQIDRERAFDIIKQQTAILVVLSPLQRAIPAHGRACGD